ncbi:hypothetical protein ACJ8LB_21840 [Serratia sp. CY58181]|uniref:hypothetical protein n=1 Tax=Serratia sp. CY58181 TaxID=3383644 RepID=UPI003FA06387
MMGRDYKDESERESDYRQWLKYRESSWEERNGQQHEEHQQESRGNGVFRQFPNHQKLIEKAEREYFDSLKKEDE